MLETLRAFAQEQLTPEECAALGQRHGEYFVALAQRAGQDLLDRQPDSLQEERYDAERENFRAALTGQWSAETSKRGCVWGRRSGGSGHGVT
jgi:hypothetical protein